MSWGTNAGRCCGCAGRRSFIFKLIVRTNWRVESTNCLGAPKNAGGRILRPGPKAESQPGKPRLYTKSYLMLEPVLQEIRTGRRFVVTSHARPDGDGIGSALACGQILRVMGKDAEVVMHDGVPRIYQNLPFADRVVQAETVPSNDAVVLLECDSMRRTLLEGLEECFLINIDHHASGRNF